MLCLGPAKLFSIIILGLWNFQSCSGLQSYRHELPGVQNSHPDLTPAFGIEASKNPSSRQSFQQGPSTFGQNQEIGHHQHHCDGKGGFDQGNIQLIDFNPRMEGSMRKTPKNPHQITSGLSSMYTSQQGQHLPQMEYNGFGNYRTYESTFNNIHPQRNLAHFPSIYPTGQPSLTEEENTHVYTPYDVFPSGPESIQMHLQSYDSNSFGNIGSSEPVEHLEASQEDMLLQREVIPLYQEIRQGNMASSNSNPGSLTESFSGDQHETLLRGPIENLHTGSAHNGPIIYAQPYLDYVQHGHGLQEESSTNNVIFDHGIHPHEIEIPTGINSNHYVDYESLEPREESWLEDICPDLYSSSYLKGGHWPAGYIPNTVTIGNNVKLNSKKNLKDLLIPTDKKDINQNPSKSHLQDTSVTAGPQAVVSMDDFTAALNGYSYMKNPTNGDESYMTNQNTFRIDDELNLDQSKRKWANTSAKLSKISNKKSRNNLKGDLKNTNESSSHLAEDNLHTSKTTKTSGRYRSSSLIKHLDGEDQYHIPTMKDNFKLSQSIGIMNVNRSFTLCYEIFDWFHDIYKRISVKCKDNSEIKALSYALRNACHGIVMSFLGILKAFEYDGSGKDKLQDLLDDGWRYMQNLFAHWKIAEPQDFEFGKLTRFQTECDIMIPGWQLKYLKGIRSVDSLPFTLIWYLAHTWSIKEGNKRIPKNINLEILMEVYKLDVSSTEGGLYSRSGIRNDVFWGADQFSRKLQLALGSAEDLSQRKPLLISDAAQFHTGIGRQMCKHVHIFFEKLIHDLISCYKESNHNSFHESLNDVAANIPIKIHSSNINLIVQAVSFAQYKITVSYMGAIRNFYKKELSEEQIKVLLMDAWEFLNKIYSRWLEIDFQPKNHPDLFLFGQIDTSDSIILDNPTLMFNIHIQDRHYTPKKAVLNLLSFWNNTLRTKIQGSEEYLGFPVECIPSQQLYHRDPYCVI
ncbi:uncharacterized protein MELLADRAFT_107590 [Melampsora larici-populina 98AG31]|uniref:Uncharacterized protein n=1 Tax=Melampsora larici-populina (strain 98AG31 / pathotype 3-4-7) TaxID=747676 RepID=F4RQ50_MELLP|nr:uncharacterized protein MELLADRAFT_107590 [Melampsora larici-populina 98AG31]EGG05471.1 hypothetical protein MELLADRAFT_107590 [Melampsora larici-populina 98AG31]